MYSSEHFAWQLWMYATMFAMYLGAVIFALKASLWSRMWLGLLFLVTYLENVVAFPAALFGYARHQWMLGNPEMTRYLYIVLVSMCSTGAAFFLFTRNNKLPWGLDKLPALTVNENHIRRAAFSISVLGAIVSIVISATGYYGYYTVESHLYKPPLWLGSARHLVAFSIALSFVIFFSIYTEDRRMRAPGWILLCLWAFAGLVSGFKTYVVLPFFFLAVTAWLVKRLRLAHFLLLAEALLLAYSVVEPLRQMRIKGGYENPLESLDVLLSGGQFAAAELSGSLDSFTSRIDYSATAVAVLELDRFGIIDRYRARLDQTYVLIPMLAFVPLAVWPEKPLSDLGRELSIAVSGNEHNSITPSGVVASYLWFGFFGVVLNGVIGAYFLVLAGRMLDKYLHRPLAYIPVVFLVLVFSMPTSIMAYHYISILRVLVVVALFYLFAGAFGLTSRINRGNPMPSLKRSNREPAFKVLRRGVNGETAGKV